MHENLYRKLRATTILTSPLQIPGRKNLVIQRALAGPLDVLVKFASLKERGVDGIFYLENDNVDSTQKNVIFLSIGEKASAPIAIAGMDLSIDIASPSLPLV